MKEKNANMVIAGALLWFLSLIVLIPLLLIAVNSFKTAGESVILTLALPETWQFRNYPEVFANTNIISTFFNSVFISVLSIGGSVFLGATAGYALSRRRDRLNKIIHAYFLVGMIVPVQIIALVQLLQKIRMMNSYAGLIFVYMAMFLPQTVFMTYGFVNTVPREMDEAAIVDGCNPIQMYLRVVLPLLKPVIVTLFITQFVFVWNDFQMPLYIIRNSSRWTIVLGVYNFLGQYNSEWNMVCAYILLSSLPAIIVYLFGQKYIIDGMVAGAIKG